jgi:hypothetical protein
MLKIMTKYLYCFVFFICIDFFAFKYPFWKFKRFGNIFSARKNFLKTNKGHQGRNSIPYLEHFSRCKYFKKSNLKKGLFIFKI